MLAFGLCILAFISCYLAGRRSLGLGLAVLLIFGYFYGILRANLLTTFSHFIFDAGMLGLYLSPWWRSGPQNKKGLEPLWVWGLILIVWPALIVLLPFQPLLVSLVGFRGNVFFIPVLLLGSHLSGKNLIRFSTGLAVLNLVALAFASAEYFLGVERFFPLSPVTMIMYASNDVAGGFLRIPATFVNAHAFAGTMLATMPFLFGLWNSTKNRLCRLLALTAIPAALVGVLLSATRSNFVIGCAMVTFVLFRAQIKAKQRVLFLLIMAGVAAAALTNARFQRFKTLDDTDYVSERIAGSVNRNFLEILTEYPMGNGLGGGGTSIPYFLEGQVRNPIGMENEYARILSEQGVIGLLLWLAFIGWFVFRSRRLFGKSSWATARRLTWCLTLLALASACLGTGLLTSIPETMLLMLGIGWLTVPQEATPPLQPYREQISLQRARIGYASELR